MRQYPLVGVLGRRVALAEVAECLPELLCGRCDQVVQRSSVVVLVVALRGGRRSTVWLCVCRVPRVSAKFLRNWVATRRTACALEDCC